MIGTDASANSAPWNVTPTVQPAPPPIDYNRPSMPIRTWDSEPARTTAPEPYYKRRSDESVSGNGLDITKPTKLREW